MITLEPTADLRSPANTDRPEFNQGWGATLKGGMQKGENLFAIRGDIVKVADGRPFGPYRIIREATSHV